MDRTPRTHARRPFTGPERWLRGEPVPDQRLPAFDAAPAAVGELLAGLEERPGRPLDQLLARSIYDEIVWLTAETGVLHLTFAKLADRVNAARARLRRPARATGRVTIAKVSAVIRRMVAAGWLTQVRKTARQAVFGVARAVARGGSRGGTKELPVNYQDPPTFGGKARSKVPDATWPSGGDEQLGDEHLLASARSLASGIVDARAGQLRCRGTRKGSGAWWLWLVARLRWFDPEQQQRLAGVYAERIDRLIARRGVAWLRSDDLTVGA